MLRNKKTLYFLHINKAGGTYVKDVLNTLRRDSSAAIRFCLYSHDRSVLDVPCGRPFFFTIRDPFERMCSSAYQLFRTRDSNFEKSGYIPKWERFLNPFEDAESYINSLCNPSDEQHTLAKTIYSTLPHLSKSYWDFFISEDYFQAKSSQILIALKTDRLSEELPRMLKDIGIDVREKQQTDLDLTERLNRSSGMPSYGSVFARESQRYYEEYIAAREYKFYKSAMDYTKFDDRYKIIVDRLISPW
jgi:hypothetical protein